MLPPVFHLLTDDVAVAAIVGMRIYRHGSAPQKVTQPYITWSAFGTPQITLGERPRLDEYIVRVDCWSNSDTEIEALGRACRDAIEGKFHVTQIDEVTRDRETMRYRLGLVYTHWMHRAAPRAPIILPAAEYITGDAVITIQGQSNFSLVYSINGVTPAPGIALPYTGGFSVTANDGDVITVMAREHSGAYSSPVTTRQYIFVVPYALGVDDAVLGIYDDTELYVGGANTL